MRIRGFRLWISACAASLCAPLAAQSTQRASVDSNGGQVAFHCSAPSLSADGRYVAFASFGALVPGDTNGDYDVFVHDRETGTTELVSVDSWGIQGDAASDLPVISADGRYVAFLSLADNLAPDDTNGAWDLFVRDRQRGTTERVNVSTNGAEANDDTNAFAISGDGRYVAFASYATNLAAGDTNGSPDIFVRDLAGRTTEIVSLTTAGLLADAPSYSPAISADGRYVAFASYATNLAPGDTNAFSDVYVRDRQLGTTERASVDSFGVQANGASSTGSISSGGRYVTFSSRASNLVPGDTNGTDDVFLHDRQTGATVRVSVSSAGLEGTAASTGPSSVSGDGRFVAFTSAASNLAQGPVNAFTDVFVRDLLLGATELASVSSGGIPGNDVTDGFVTISGDGRFVAFASFAANLVPGDTNQKMDVFVRDRTGGATFTSLCEPGAGGVVGCPCANAPSGPGRGCDNSAATGGATLAASGATLLSSDSLVFTTSGEKPAAMSVLLQGTTSIPAGAVYGQGVRCVGGKLERLFTKNAVDGSLTVPQFLAGDPSVSARSAAMGSPIAAGEIRTYLVVYRDPIVLGGCPASSTINATQTGRVEWSP